MNKIFRSKYPLSTQTKKVMIIIRKNKVIPLFMIKNYCESYFTEYAFIEHRNDLDPITKDEIGCHYHIVGKYNKEKTSLETILNKLIKYFRFDNSNGVQIDKWDNYVKSIQYLIHKNNPEKTQHKVNEIITNIPQDDFKLIMESQSDDIISFDLVYATCYTCMSLVDVIRTLGFKSYHKYRNTILDIWNSISHDLSK